MQLGAMQPKKGAGIMAASDFDFTPIEHRLQAIETKQNYILIALAILVLITLLKNK